MNIATSAVHRMQCVLRNSRAIRRHSLGSVAVFPVFSRERRLSQFHSAAHGSSVPQEDSLPGTLHGKLNQLKESSSPHDKPKKNLLDSFALVAGWGVVALGFAISLHGSRSMISCANERRRSLEESMEKLPHVDIMREELFKK